MSYQQILDLQADFLKEQEEKALLQRRARDLEDELAQARKKLEFTDSIEFDERVSVYWIRSTIAGKALDVLYAHMDPRQAPSGIPSGFVPAGTVIGKADNSGSLGRAMREGLAVQHLHIEVREVSGALTWNERRDLALDPEDFVTTKFDEHGNVVPGTSC